MTLLQMDDLTPETVNLGAAAGLVRSLYKTVTLLDPYYIVTNLTGVPLTLEDFREPLTYIHLNGTAYNR